MFDWKDKALEFYDYLVSEADFNPLEWREVFEDYYGEFRSALFSDDFAEFYGPIIPAEGHIANGLVRNANQEHAETSPLSIKWWYNKKIWSIACDDEDRRAYEVKQCQAMCSYLAQRLYSHYVESGKQECANDFMTWLIETGSLHKLQQEHRDDIARAERNQPALDPVEVEGLPDDEKAKALCHALWYDIWGDKTGAQRRASDSDKQQVYDTLSGLIEKYLSGELSFPRETKHDVIRDLLNATRWCPDDTFWPGLPPHAAQLSNELIFLMRSRIVYEVEKFNPFDYQRALNVVVHQEKSPDKALSLLNAKGFCKIKSRP